MVRGKFGQIWIETVVYTLIAFVMIGLVLGYAKPAIEKLQDKAIIEQSIVMLDEINNIISSIKEVPGNQRVVEVGLKKGELRIDGENDRIIFEIESLYEYSEPGTNVSRGDIVAYTNSEGKYNIITLTRDYSLGYDLQSEGENVLKTITPAPNPYSLLISNKGTSSNKTIINLEVS